MKIQYGLTVLATIAVCASAPAVAQTQPVSIPAKDFGPVWTGFYVGAAFGAGGAVNNLNSSGGALAIDFVLAHPEMVEGLILLGPVVHGISVSPAFIERGSQNNAPLQNGDTKSAADKRKDVAARVIAISRDSGPIAASRAKVALSGLFSWAMQAGLAESNPALNVPEPKQPPARDRVLSDAELAAKRGEKTKIGFGGGTIRTYELNPTQRVKDHRTLTVSNNPTRVLDGDLKPFIESYLREQIGKPEGK